jgi:phosphopantothenoylcysteine decarboxylase
MDHARDAISARLSDDFASTHSKFLSILKESRVEDEAFLERLSGKVTAFGKPISEELIETVFVRNKNRVIEHVHIGKRVTQFKKSLEANKSRLDEGWKQWQDLQDEYIVLGVEVFGNEMFGHKQALQPNREKGYKHEMEKLAIEHNAKLKVYLEDINIMKVKTDQDMKVQERVGGINFCHLPES